MKRLFVLISMLLITSCFRNYSNPKLIISNKTNEPLNNVSVVIHGGGKDSSISVGTIAPNREHTVPLEISYDYHAELWFTPPNGMEYHGRAIGYHCRGMGCELVAIEPDEKSATYVLKRTIVKLF